MSKPQRLIGGIPVLPGYIQDAGTKFANLRVWCRWCCHWHTHGVTVPVGETTHRVAHCHATDSPFQDTGYWIEVTGVDYADVARTVKTATAAQQRAMSVGRITDGIRRLRAQPAPSAAS